MHALILAAGRGDRMRPFTDDTPKPLLRAGPRRLIEYHIAALAAAGIAEIVINVSYLADQITSALGDGDRYGVRISYSHEPDGPLETGGGIARALPLLHSDPFAVVNSDIWTDYDFRALSLPSAAVVHLVMVHNPGHHPGGDFCLQQGNLRRRDQNPGHALTFSGIGVYRHRLFEHSVSGKSFPLAPLLEQAINNGEASGELFNGRWMDVGTPERLQSLRHKLDQCD